MANELKLSHPTPSKTDLYAVIRNEDTLKVWDGTGMVTWADANIGNYKIALTFRSGDLYTADAPANLGAGVYRVYYYDQTGASAAVTDPLLTVKDLVWNPTASAAPTSSPGDTSPSRIEAVNEILEAVMLSPVSSLDTGGSSDAAMAEVLLNRYNQRIQNEGWHCNTEENVTLTPDGNNQIQLGSDILRVDLDPKRSSRDLDMCKRGSVLFDRKNNTTTITQTVVVELIRELPFENLSPALKAYIVAKASVEFQRSKFGSRKIDRTLLDKLEYAEQQARREDNNVGDFNFLNNDGSRETVGVGRVLTTECR